MRRRSVAFAATNLILEASSCRTQKRPRAANEPAKCEESFIVPGGNGAVNQPHAPDRREPSFLWSIRGSKGNGR